MLRFSASAIARHTRPRPVLAMARRTMVTVKVDDQGVALVTFNNPEKLNAMTEAMGDSFVEAIDQLKRMGRSELRAVVITGAGRAFSAGGDMNFLTERTKTDALTNAEVMRRFYARFLSIRSLEVPTIAAINGAAIGAGLCVACACDIRVCSVSAKMGWTFVGLGLHPGMAATHFVPQILGSQQASRWLLTGGTFDGAEAKSMGLVVDAVAPGYVVARALELAGEIAKQSPDAVQSLVRTLRNAQDVGLQQALAREADCQGHNYASEDCKEGITAIIEKRAPRFSKL